MAAAEAAAEQTNISSMLASLSTWLAAQSISLDRVEVVPSLTGTGLSARSLVRAQAGDTILELCHGACLTARVAYADREFGRDLQLLADRVGPGFGSVALAAFLAAERVRDFKAESWYAGSAAEQLGSAALSRESAWSPVTRAYWDMPSAALDSDLIPLVRQGIQLVLPQVELAARRAWVPGAAQANVASRKQTWSRDELTGVLGDAFARVLAHQWPTPPPTLPSLAVAAEPNAVASLEDEPAQRWGYSDDAPEGPALLPPLQGLLCRGDDHADRGNIILGVPPQPRAGSRASDVSVRCIATRRIERGDLLIISRP